MPQIIDPDRLDAIILDSDLKKPKPTIFWVRRLDALANARMEAMTTSAHSNATAAGFQRTDPEVYEKTRDAELAFLASKVSRIEDWPGREGQDITDTAQIVECLRKLVWAEYLEFLQKMVGIQQLTAIEGKASDSPS